MTAGIKHLVECHCVLPQFRGRPDPIFHKFIVFSILNDDDTVIPKIVKCNNCAVIHRVTDMCCSEFIYDKEDTASIITEDDIKFTLSEKLVNILEAYNVDLPTWEQAQFIMENKQWNSFVILTSDMIDGRTEGKLLRIIGDNLYKMEPFFRDEYIDLND